MPVLDPIGSQSSVAATARLSSGITLIQKMTEVERWMEETLDKAVPSKCSDAINDAIESLWEAIITVRVSDLVGGPATLNFAAASERAQLVSIADPTVALVPAALAQGLLPAQTEYYAYTYVTESGTETNISLVANIQRPLNSVTQIPPPAMPTGAFGWNLYAGLASDQLVKQNEAPLDFGLNWVEDANGLLTVPEGSPPPLFNSTGDNIWSIAHMEAATPQGTYKAWNQADLDSLFMRNQALGVASNLPYQSYAFDLISGGTVEIRPAAGTDLAPRHFFIVKPRRLMFPEAPLPFGDQPSSAYIRYFAISLLKLSEEEYQAAGIWDGKASQQLTQIRQAVSVKSSKSNNSVTPFLRR